jgi:hypothetical protein
MDSRRPSINDSASGSAISASSLLTLFKTFTPNSLWTISRPRNSTYTFTLLPCFRNSIMCFTLNLKSCSSVLGRNLISFKLTVCCFFLAILAFFDCSYKNLPKSMILHTGGLTVGATSTRSRPFSLAISRAFSILTIPTCCPLSSISLTSGDLILSLTLILGSRALTIKTPPDQ